MFKQIALPYFLLPLLLALLFMGGLVYGAVSIPLESVIDILLGKDVAGPPGRILSCNPVSAGGYGFACRSLAGYQRSVIADPVP